MGKSLAATKRAFTIRYDAGQRAWIARNHTRSYQHADKRRVLLWVLKQEHPQLWGLVHGMACAASADGNGRGIPLPFVDRLIRAARLITDGRVNFPAMQVRSQAGDETYQVQHDGLPRTWTCSCRDFASGGFDTLAYGPVCKHILAILLMQFLAAQTSTARDVRYDDQGDFLQSMDDAQAKRLRDPRYVQALLDGGDAVFWYALGEVLNAHTPQLYRNAQGVLFIGDLGREENRRKEITIQAIRSWTCNEFAVERLFEIPELDGEQYQQFWLDFYMHTRDGAFSRLKAELIDAIRQLI